MDLHSAMHWYWQTSGHFLTVVSRQPAEYLFTANNRLNTFLAARNDPGNPASFGAIVT
jgi:hypothetical protein